MITSILFRIYTTLLNCPNFLRHSVYKRDKNYFEVLMKGTHL